MSQIKSALLNILPASERGELQTTAQAGIRMFEGIIPTQQKPATKLYLANIKRQLKDLGARSFKYNAKRHSLYAYFTTVHRAHAAINALTKSVTSTGVYESGMLSIRVDNVFDELPVVSSTSMAAPTAPVSVKQLPFDDFVADVKTKFTNTFAEFKHIGTTIRIVGRQIQLHATANRRSGTLFQKAVCQLSYAYDNVTVVTCGEYTLHVVVTDTVGLKQPNGQVTDPATFLATFEDRLSEELTSQFRRIIAGERLPAPAEAIYDDLDAVSKTQGSAVAMFYKNNKRVSIEGILLDLVEKEKTAAIFPAEIQRIVLHDVVVEDPIVVVLRDYGNVDNAFLVITTKKGFYRHVALKKRK